MKFDFQIENFRRFFDLKMTQITSIQKDRLPIDLVTKIFKTDGSITNKLIPFETMLYALTQSGISNLYVHVEDFDSGLSVADFEKFKKQKKKKRIEYWEAQEALDKGLMVISGKDIAEYVNHLNGVATSGSLNYSLKEKKTKKPKMPDVDGEFLTLCRLISNYEGNKKNIIYRQNLNMPELYVLLYLHDGQERNGTHIYRQHFASAINSSRIQFLNAFNKLSRLGYVNKSGKAKAITYKITYLGKSVLTDILKKYVLV